MENTPDVKHLLLQNEVEQFLYREAAAIDQRNFESWLTFFSSDVRYWMPIRRNVPFKKRFDDLSRDNETAWIDDTKTMMESRVAQIMTGVHWAEDPLSRVSHLITNVVIDRPYIDVEGSEIGVQSKFLVHRARLDTEVDLLIGRREDRLRRVQGTFQVCFRKIIIDQTTLTSKNLSFFV
jgi:3-phenylpropionate/cinnamic acid dioxygenase small subunit